MTEPPAKKRAVDGPTQRAGFGSEEEMSSFFETVEALLGKAREGLDVWGELLEGDSEWFFELLLKIDLSALPAGQAIEVLLVLSEAYNSLENQTIRERLLPLVSVPLCLSLSNQRREFEVANFPKLKKPVQKIVKQLEKDPDFKKVERKFFPNLLATFLERLDQAGRAGGEADEEVLTQLCCRYTDFFIELMSQMPTRRFLHAYLDDANLTTYCKLSRLYSSQRSMLFKEMVDSFEAVMTFPVDNQTAEALSADDVESRYCARAAAFQRIAFRDYPEKMKAAAMCNISALDERSQVKNFVKKLSDAELTEVCGKAVVVDPKLAATVGLGRNFLIESLTEKLSRKPDQSDLNRVSLYPDETVMFNPSLVPSQRYTGATPYALPKLNLQFLSIQDYLLRNFKLIQLESAYEIAQDIEDVLTRNPVAATPSGPRISGVHRMALQISSMQVIKVAPPPIGFTMPVMVRAEAHFNLAGLARYPHIASEWDGLRQHDVLVFVKLRRPVAGGSDIKERLGVDVVRGAEVVDVRDDDGNVVTGYDAGVKLVGTVRHVRVSLDPVAFQKDVASGNQEIYEKFDIVIRRRPQENNFKAVLDTIRELMHNPTSVPSWLHDVFLGYGDAASAHYTNLESKSDDESASDDDSEDDVITSSPLSRESVFLYNTDKPPHYDMTFSPQQATAIRTASHEGLSLVVGPPGTGKTDVAVQIITNLYHKYPEQNTLVITHSNAALNDIFQKVMAKDVDERHLLRLGSGERDLDTTKDFSRLGRINYILERRLALLARVERLCESIEVDKGFAQTCEAAGNFFRHHIEPRWVKFLQEVEGDQTARRVVAMFPFEKYFADSDRPLWEFAGDFPKAMSAAHRAWDHLKRLFAELDDCRAFELLRSSQDRGNYLLSKQAKVIAMTCTHAALKRRDFLKLNFRYDNLIMEEAGQILEVETFIPMVLQRPLESGESRLKRVVLIGDHNQLPPVVKNPTFEKYCKMGQSMFTRFVRLGVPYTLLDAQGRMRPQLADVFRWRYGSLSDLPHVKSNTLFLTANGGFGSPCQCIDVADGVETQPQPHFYQNLQEAEFVVATFMFMRLLGYEAGKITILTTYNGQKHLIKDVLNHRCRKGSIYAEHPKVSTVDKFQGQQNDFILLSLVRTEKVGHLRDVRRLVVAMSRARLGMYVFCKVGLFKEVWELKKAFDEILKAPTQLELCTDEVQSSTDREVGSSAGSRQKVATFAQLTSLITKLESVLITEERRRDAAAATEAVQPPAAVPAPVAIDASGIFSPASGWQGPRPGWYFGTGQHGLGYYLDKEGEESLQRRGGE